VGANLFGFKQTLADDRFQVDPDLPLPLPTETDDFILQMAPGISLEVERLTLSLASENLLDYNFRAKEANTTKADKIFMSLLSYDFPIAMGSATNAFLRPSMYLRTLPGQANQVGFYTLLNTDGYWMQAGYNNFYGYSLGAGVTFFKRLSIGALAEFGTGASMVTEPSFELMATYFLGKPDARHKMVGHDLKEDGKEEAIAAEKLQKQLELEAEKERLAEQQAKEQEALAEAERMARQRETDSINKIRQTEAQQRRIDSVAQAMAAARKVEEAERTAAAKARKEAEVQPEVETKPQADEKYEEVATEAGMLPGYYLIANVFGTQEYFNAFMADLKRKGIQPKSFRRSTNGYNYVYLQRYKTLREAREARGSKYGGKYTGKTWIFRVVGE
ncbi:MAG TPA: type IX secretion system membrane protein PorP/SprF, partial [Pricia sp.]|nr:type IX secretion system membrane protein PorP/SprF [Pricia sp.]